MTVLRFVAYDMVCLFHVCHRLFWSLHLLCMVTLQGTLINFYSFVVNIYAFSRLERNLPSPRPLKKFFYQLHFHIPIGPIIGWEKFTSLYNYDVISHQTRFLIIDTGRLFHSSVVNFLHCCVVLLLLCRIGQESSHNLLTIVFYNRLKINYQY